MPDDLELDDNYLNIPDTIDLDRAVAFEHPSRPGTVVFSVFSVYMVHRPLCSYMYMDFLF